MKVHTDIDLYVRIRKRVERLWRQDRPIHVVDLTPLEFEELKEDDLIDVSYMGEVEEYSLWIPEIQDWVSIRRVEK